MKLLYIGISAMLLISCASVPNTSTKFDRSYDYSAVMKLMLAPIVNTSLTDFQVSSSLLFQGLLAEVDLVRSQVAV